MADTDTREQSPEQSRPQSPLLAAMAMQPAPLPPSLVSAAHRALALQAEGKMHQAERVLEGLLRSLTAPAILPLGPTGALLYLWRSRSRRGVGRSLEADADLWIALAHVGVHRYAPPSPQTTRRPRPPPRKPARWLSSGGERCGPREGWRARSGAVSVRGCRALAASPRPTSSPPRTRRGYSQPKMAMYVLGAASEYIRIVTST